jgi:hypothetical protein
VDPYTIMYASATGRPLTDRNGCVARAGAHPLRAVGVLAGPVVHARAVGLRGAPPARQVSKAGELSVRA